MIAALGWSGSWPYVVGSWAISAGVIVGYTVSLIRRGRRLSRDVAPESRRWM